jgi:hypothetical protein
MPELAGVNWCCWRLQPPPSLELVVAWQTGVALVDEVVGFAGRCWSGMRGMWGAADCVGLNRGASPLHRYPLRGSGLARDRAQDQRQLSFTTLPPTQDHPANPQQQAFDHERQHKPGANAPAIASGTSRIW